LAAAKAISSGAAVPAIGSGTAASSPFDLLVGLPEPLASVLAYLGDDLDTR
jgi:hypothetical protein